DNQVGPVLRIFAAPHQLRVAQFELAGLRQLLHLFGRDMDAGALPDQLRIAMLLALTHYAIGQRTGTRILEGFTRGAVFFPPKVALHLRRGDVPPRRYIMLERPDLLPTFGIAGHEAA